MDSKELVSILDKFESHIDKKLASAIDAFETHIENKLAAVIPQYTKKIKVVNNTIKSGVDASTVSSMISSAKSEIKRDVGYAIDALEDKIPEKQEPLEPKIVYVVGDKGAPGDDGKDGNTNVFIQDTDPALSTPYVWYQTENGLLKTIWVNIV